MTNMSLPMERMKPLKDRAVEGRANPKGIPYLYLATNRETALAEVRPWIGSLISVGAFEILRELRIVNCSSDDHNIIYREEPPPEEREKAVWVSIDRAFSRPVDPSDDVAAYVPTQILAELFKAEGYDGIWLPEFSRPWSQYRPIRSGRCESNHLRNPSKLRTSALSSNSYLPIR